MSEWTLQKRLLTRVSQSQLPSLLKCLTVNRLTKGQIVFNSSDSTFCIMQQNSFVLV